MLCVSLIYLIFLSDFIIIAVFSGYKSCLHILLSLVLCISYFDPVIMMWDFKLFILQLFVAIL
jgi:hypothetical protein